MQITFSYEDDYRPTLTTVSTDGVKVEIAFESETIQDPFTVTVAEQEYEPTDDNLYGLFVRFEKSPLVFEYVSVAVILAQAEKQIDGIISEAEEEDRDWSRHVQSFSHPY